MTTMANESNSTGTMYMMVATGVITMALVGAWFVVQKEVTKRRESEKLKADSSIAANGSSHKATDAPIDRTVRNDTC